MNIWATTVDDATLYEIDRFDDSRGYFQELLSHRVCPEFNCKQINYSFSKKHVLRGIHIAKFAKLVHCVKGAIFDVVVDTRPSSKTFGKWYGVELTDTNHKSLYIPPNCGHAFLALQADTIVVYAQDGFYDTSGERSVRYDDPVLAIKWPVSQMLNISEKDINAPLFNIC